MCNLFRIGSSRWELRKCRNHPCLDYKCQLDSKCSSVRCRKSRESTYTPGQCMCQETTRKSVLADTRWGLALARESPESAAPAA